MTKQVFDFEPPKGFLNRNQLIQILKAQAKPDDRMISLRLENNGREYDFMYELKSGRFQLHDRETGEKLQTDWFYRKSESF